MSRVTDREKAQEERLLDPVGSPPKSPVLFRPTVVAYDGHEGILALDLWLCGGRTWLERLTHVNGVPG